MKEMLYEAQEAVPTEEGNNLSYVCVHTCMLACVAGHSLAVYIVSHVSHLRLFDCNQLADK